MVYFKDVLEEKNKCQFHQRSSYCFCPRRSRKLKKIQLGHQCLFTFLGSTSIKAVLRMLVKLSPGVNFINIFWTHFSYKNLAPKQWNPKHSSGIFWAKISYEKRTQKRWWNWPLNKLVSQMYCAVSFTLSFY